VILQAGGLIAMGAVHISSRHCRAICDEVGERLRQHLDGTQTSPSQRILMLLRELEAMEAVETPSIVPSLDDISAPLFEETSSSA
jgi:hypothetical protein